MSFFYVTVEVIQTVTVDVEADSAKEAKVKACDIVAKAGPDVEYNTWYAEATNVAEEEDAEEEDDA